MWCYGRVPTFHFTLKMEATSVFETLVSYHHNSYTTSRLRSPRLGTSLPWKPQNLLL